MIDYDLAIEIGATHSLNDGSCAVFYKKINGAYKVYNDTVGFIESARTQAWLEKNLDEIDTWAAIVCNDVKFSKQLGLRAENGYLCADNMALSRESALELGLALLSALGVE